MGWRRCDGCGRTISDRAPSCPFCAAPGALAAAGVLTPTAVPVAAAPAMTPAVVPAARVATPAYPLAPTPAVTAGPSTTVASKFWEPSTPDGLAGPTRLAGWILIVGGVASALAPMADFARSGAVVDVVLGAALVLNKRAWRVFGFYRVVIGTVVWPIVAIVQHDMVTLVVQLLYSISLLVLLQERPRRAFVPWAIGMAGLVLFLTYLGLMMMFLQRQQATPERVNTPRRSR